MSLRLRLIVLVTVVLVLSLALGSLIAFFNASRSVRTEMRSALQVGRQTIENAEDDLAASPDPRHDLGNLVASFKGNRHVRVALSGAAGAQAAPVVERSPFGQAPPWFVRLIGVAPASERVPIALAGRPYATVDIQTDPNNEILEVWNQFGDSMIVLALFCGQTVILIYLSIGRALRPLDRLGAALEQVGHGAYRTRLEGRLAPELSRLRDSFNRMAERLAAVDADNRRLNARLLTLQEEERGELARDLHDEVSPFLFAINIDIANLSRLLREGRAAEAPPHLESIAEAVGHLQSEVRSMLGRLRPPGLAEFGLGEAVRSMVGFWRRRHPGIDFEVAIAPDCDRLGTLIGTTAYRIVQECVSNSVRHGNPARIEVRIERLPADRGEGGEVQLDVSDDGCGMGESTGAGLGLTGIAERVEATGGRLTLSNRPGGGLSLSAVLPCGPRPLAPAPAATASVEVEPR
jgi:two-component system sensor histidine kinase UhpB